MEIWRSIPNYENYEVSNKGRVKRNGFILKSPPCPLYPTVALCKNGIVKIHRVHVLVALLFIGERPKGLVIDHINRNKLDNRVENLRYIRQVENIYNNFKWDRPENKRILTHRKISIYSKEIKKDLQEKKFSQSQIAKKYGLHESTISRWVNGSRNIMGGKKRYLI